jgi:hypothetical protein
VTLAVARKEESHYFAVKRVLGFSGSAPHALRLRGVSLVSGKDFSSS